MKTNNENNKKKLESALCDAANGLRGSMDANEYKIYTLGTIFFKFLSDRMLYKVAELIDDDTDATLEKSQAIYEENEGDEDLIDELKKSLGYVLDAKNTYTNILNSVYEHTFQLSKLDEAFRQIERKSNEFEGLFEDYDLHSKKLGSTDQKKTNTIAELLSAIGRIELVHTKGDVLGDAYEYLIKQFASESGKKAGEFYTPQQVSELLTKLTLVGKDYSNGMSVYDPTMGSGSLLLNFKKYLNKGKGRINYYGQEINTSTFNLARMNMILHHVDLANQHLRNADTLEENSYEDENKKFDSVVMNPPYSLRWSASDGFKEDARFAKYGVLPPKSKADYAFILHGYYHLKHSGTMAIVLPHGVLFRGGTEGKIRKQLLEDVSIDAVIGLPANLFYSTSIPTMILVLKKDKTNRDVMFIDASSDFEKFKTQNVLREEDLQRILDAYSNRKDVDKYAHLASFDEIKENDFNLNIPRYVDTFEPEPEVDLKGVSEELQSIFEKEKQNGQELVSMLKELNSKDSNVKEGVDAFINTLQSEFK